MATCQVGRERQRDQAQVRRDVRDDHGGQQPDAAGDERCGEERRGLDQADAEEQQAQLLARRVELPPQEHDDQRLDDEPAGERVDGEEERQPGHDGPRPAERRLGRRAEPVLGLDVDAQRAGDEGAEERDGDEDEEQPGIARRSGQQAAEELRPAGQQGADRAGERGGRVVDAEARGEAVVLELAGQHRLLEAGERPALDDLGRQRAREHDRDEDGQLAGRGQRDADRGQGHVQPDVAAPASDPIAVAADEDRHQREAGHDARQQQADAGRRPARGPPARSRGGPSRSRRRPPAAPAPAAPCGRPTTAGRVVGRGPSRQRATPSGNLAVPPTRRRRDCGDVGRRGRAAGAHEAVQVRHRGRRAGPARPGRRPGRAARPQRRGQDHDAADAPRRDPSRRGLGRPWSATSCPAIARRRSGRSASSPATCRCPRT